MLFHNQIAQPLLLVARSSPCWRCRIGLVGDSTAYTMGELREMRLMLGLAVVPCVLLTGCDRRDGRDDCVTGATIVDNAGGLTDIRWADGQLLLVDRATGSLVEIVLVGDRVAEFEVTNVPFEEPDDPSDDRAVQDGFSTTCP